MKKNFFERTGIKLTERQKGILKAFVRMICSFVVAGVAVLLSGHPLWQVSKECKSTEISTLFHSSADSVCNYQQNINFPGWLFILVLLVLAYGVIPFVVKTLSYCIKVLFNKDFREQEMADSVNYIEEDEREQYATMVATRRSYMVLNFAILIGWIAALLSGNLSAALLLFIIQSVGAISFRRHLAV